MIFGPGTIIPPTQPRQTESTDTRQAIQRHDPDQGKNRGKKDKEQEEDLFDMDDQATVSISALRTFLGNFLYNSEAQKRTQNTDNTEDSGHENHRKETSEPKEQEIRKPVSEQAARAANAYQTMANRTDRRAAPRQSVDASEAEKLGLSAADTRALHQLLDDLRELSNRGMEYISIERGDSFLESLLSAVEKAKLQ